MGLQLCLHDSVATTALMQGLGLCHDITGHAHTLLTVWRLTKQDIWRHQALQAVLFAADKWSDLAETLDAPCTRVYRHCCILV